MRQIFELLRSAGQLARQALRRQLTRAFFHISKSLPAKYLVANELAPHISWIPAAETPYVRGRRRALTTISGGSLPEVLDFRASPIWNLCALLRCAIRNL